MVCLNNLGAVAGELPMLHNGQRWMGRFVRGRKLGEVQRLSVWFI